MSKTWDDVARRIVQEFARADLMRKQSLSIDFSTIISFLDKSIRPRRCSAFLQEEGLLRENQRLVLRVQVGKVSKQIILNCPSNSPLLYEELQDLTLGGLEQAIEEVSQQEADDEQGMG